MWRCNNENFTSPKNVATGTPPRPPLLILIRTHVLSFVVSTEKLRSRIVRTDSWHCIFNLNYNSTSLPAHLENIFLNMQLSTHASYFQVSDCFLNIFSVNICLLRVEIFITFFTLVTVSRLFNTFDEEAVFAAGTAC